MTNNNSPSIGEMISNNAASLILATLFFIGGFVVGSLWQENKMLKAGTVNTVATGTDTAPPAETGPTAEQLAALPPVTEEDHIRGNADAEIVLVEYTDFECPFCAQFHPTTQQVLDDYGDKIALVYRNYPLSFHPNAQKAGEAGECIAKLAGNDAYWNYTDAIFAKNDELGGKISPEAISESAEEVGVNMTEFQTCLDSGEMAETVTNQLNEGSASGVQGTPGTFIVTKDGVQEMIPGAYPYAQVKTIIDKYIN